MAQEMLLNIVRTSLRRKSTDLDQLELVPLIEAAKADLSAAGVERINDYDPMVQVAVMLYVRWVIERDTQMRSVYERVKNGMALNGKYRA